MSHDIVWTETALLRVEEIGDFIALDRPAAAAKMVNRLFDAVDAIAGQPRSAPQFRQAADSRIRQLTVAPYLVYYRIDDDEKRISVLTVCHQRQRRSPWERD